MRDDNLVNELKPAASATAATAISITTTMPMVKLVYFGAEGRGELTRILLNIGNIDFEDFRFSFDEWPKHKPNTPFGSVRPLGTNPYIRNLIQEVLYIPRLMFRLTSILAAV